MPSRLARDLAVRVRIEVGHELRHRLLRRHLATAHRGVQGHVVALRHLHTANHATTVAVQDASLNSLSSSIRKIMKQLVNL